MNLKNKIASTGLKFVAILSFAILVLSTTLVFAGPFFSTSSINVPTKTASIDFPFNGEKSLLQGLNAYYKLDDSPNGIVKNEVGPDAINKGATTGIAGVINTAFEFNFAPEWVDTSTEIGNETTISFWMNPHSLSSEIFGTMKDLSRDGYAGVYSSYPDRKELGIYYLLNNQVANLITVNIDSQIAQGWVHVVLTVDENNTAKLYVNGVEPPTIWNDWDTVPNSHDRALVIGDFSENPSYGFDGKLDEFGVWDRALSPEEVMKLYNNGTGLSY